MLSIGVRRAGRERRHDVAVGVAGRGDERLLRADRHGAVAGLAGAADRRPEMAARSLLAEGQRGEVPPRGGGPSSGAGLVRRGRVTGHAAQVHQVDHRGRRAPLRHGVDRPRPASAGPGRARRSAGGTVNPRSPLAPSAAIDCRGNAASRIDLRRPRREFLRRRRRPRGDNPLLFVRSIDTCRFLLLRRDESSSIVRSSAARSVHTSGSRRASGRTALRVAAASADATKTLTCDAARCSAALLADHFEVGQPVLQLAGDQRLDRVDRQPPPVARTPASR